MQKRTYIINFALVLAMLLALSTPASVFAETNSIERQSFEADPPPPEPDNPYFSSENAGSLDGNAITKNTIDGPPKPPEGFALERNSTSLPIPNKEAGINIISDVPAFDWSYGCSATSGAMIAGYYDRTAFANMYAGPTNDSVTPLNNSVWGSGESPLSATRQGLDGRATKGHVDDYWIAYGNNNPDPFYGNWPQHSWGECLGDYMKTNQTSYYDNVDGETTFYTWETYNGPLTCNDMEGYDIHSSDGTYGVKLFYQSRGYTVTDCFSQRTDVAGGFSFEDYKEEIDAGYPVMFHVYGHTMVGVGYNDVGQTMYIHDTWDYNVHTMTWGGSYSGMDMYAVSVVHLEKEYLYPGMRNDDHDALTYSTNWQTASDPGSYNSDTHYSSSTGNYVNFVFEGGKFDIYYTGNTDRGQMNVYVDGNLAGTIDQYNASPTYQSTWTSPEYAPGNHTVRLEHASGAIVDLDAIDVYAPCLELTLTHSGSGTDPVASPVKSNRCENNGEYNPTAYINLEASPDNGWILENWSGTSDNSSDELTNTLTMPYSDHTVTANYVIPPGEGTYEDTDPRIKYEGDWTIWEDSRTSGGSTRYTNDNFASASFTFTGKRVSLLFTRYTSRGDIEIHIDDDFSTTLNQYGDSISFQNRWDSPVFDDGIHEVKFRYTSWGGDHYVEVDAIVITNPESIPPAATTLAATTGSTFGEIDLNWNAPGDDGNTGTATEYIIRHSLSAINTEAQWDAASGVTGVPTPLVAGTAQSMTLSNLSAGQIYYFAMRAIDEVGNTSPLSNSPSAVAKAPDPVGLGTYENEDPNIYYTGDWDLWTDPRTSGGSTRYTLDNSAIAMLRFTGNQVSLVFTTYTTRDEIAASIDGGAPFMINQLGAFNGTLNFQQRWNSSVLPDGTHTIQLWHPGGDHYIELDALIVSHAEFDPPAAVTLNATSGSNNGEVDLDWIAPGDDGNIGTATEYIVRYASSAIDSQSAWDAAADVAGEPAPQVAGTAQSMAVSGLTPGQTYYFALRTLDDSNNLSDLSNSPSAAAKSPTPVGVGTYENEDSNIIYAGNWTVWNTASASGGSTRYSNDTSASATLTFSGRQVSLLYTGYASRGNIEITIDGGTPVLLNQYGAALSFQNRWDSPLMAAGTHTVEFSHPGGTKYIDLDAIIISDPESNPPAAVALSAATGSNLGEVNLNWNAPGDDGNSGTATSYTVRYAASAIDSQSAWDAATDVPGEPTPLVAGTGQSMTISGLTPGQTYYFALRTLDNSNNLSDLSNSPSAQAKPIVPVTEGLYQQNDPNIRYTGVWQTWSDGLASGGSITYSNDTTASAALTFTGEQIRLIYTSYTSRGDVVILIDDYEPLVFSQYGTSLVYQNWLTIYGLPAGDHTIQFVHPGGTKYIDIDALQVFTVSTYSSSEIAEDGSFAIDASEGIQP